MRLGFGIGAPYARATPVPGSPYVLPFYNDPTYGVVLYPYNAFNPATVQLYKIVVDVDKPTGYRVDLIGAPITFATGGPANSGTINGNQMILPVDNHILFTETMTADVAGKPFDFSSFGLGVLTRSGESISFNFPSGQVKSLATDSMFNHGDSHWMVRVGADAMARGYGLSLGDGSVPSTGNIASVVDGITIAGSGAASIVSHTLINMPQTSGGDPNWNMQGGSSVQHPGEFAMILGYDGSRLFGVKDYSIPTPGPFSYPWTLGGGASGVGKALAASTAGWVEPNRPNNHGPGFPTIEGTALGVLQRIGSNTGVMPYTDGASVALGSPPTVAGWPLQTGGGYFSVRWGSNAILAPPSFGDYATFKSYPTAPDFVIKYARTSQSGLSFSTVATADTAISTASYGWPNATVVGAGRHTSGIVVLGILAQDGSEFGSYYLEAVPI